MSSPSWSSPVIDIDIHEPMEIVRMVDAVVGATVIDLNTTQWADYRYTGSGGYYHWERKTAYDLTGTNDIEDQLRGQLQAHPDAHHRLVIEGVFEPAPSGLLVYRRALGKNIFTGGIVGKQPGLFKKVAGWVYEVQKYTEVYFTASMASTAALICEAYSLDQEPEDEHTTFKRHFKKSTWHPNKQVMRLMGLSWGDQTIGVVTAERAIEAFGTVWNFINADPREIGGRVRGLSKEGAASFLNHIGRMDV